MFDFPLDAKYSFWLIFTVTEKENGRSEMITYSTDVEKFAVAGGLKRTIRKNGENGIGDADIMVEFYQAKQFQNLVVTRPVDRLSAVFQRIYDRKLAFDFNFTVKTTEPDSRFRFLQLVAKRAHIVKPPSGSDGGDTLNIKYSDPRVFYSHSNGRDEKKENL